MIRACARARAGSTLIRSRLRQNSRVVPDAQALPYPPAPHETVDHAQLAGAIQRVYPQQPRGVRREDALLFLLEIRLR